MQAAINEFPEFTQTANWVSAVVSHMRITDVKLCFRFSKGAPLECAALDHGQEGSAHCLRLRTVNM